LAARRDRNSRAFNTEDIEDTENTEKSEKEKVLIYATYLLSSPT